VREAAIRVFNLHELEAERKRIEDLEKKEQERLAAEAALVQEELRLRELRKKSIPKPPPEPPSPKQEPPPPVKAPAAEPQPPAPQPAKESEKSVPTSRPVLQQAPTPPQPIKAPAEKPAVQQTVPTLTNGATQSITTAVKPAVSASDPTAPSSLRQKQLGRYKEIHGALKKLRTDIVAASKVPGSPLKGPLGNMRREIRTAIGQLTGVQGANRPAVS
jgi:nucleoporin GLE1